MKIIFLYFTAFLITGANYAQKNKTPRSIISEKSSVSKYHNKENLERMNKGELLVLYIERIESLVKTLPYIAFATKPGITMVDLGIPNDNDNRKILDEQFETTQEYLESTVGFQKRMLPYSDTNNLVAAILFYEETMRSLQEYSEFR